MKIVILTSPDDLKMKIDRLAADDARNTTSFITKCLLDRVKFEERVNK